MPRSHRRVRTVSVAGCKNSAPRARQIWNVVESWNCYEHRRPGTVQYQCRSIVGANERNSTSVYFVRWFFVSSDTCGSRNTTKRFTARERIVDRRHHGDSDKQTQGAKAFESCDGKY